LNIVARTGLLACAVAMTLQASHADDEFPVLSKEDFAARYPGLSVRDVRDAPLPGFYEVTVGNVVSYVTTDGRFLIRGEVIDMATQANVTEQRREATRAELLAAIDPATAIVFSPQDGNVKYRVTVFTDVDCGYCRQFHREIAEVNALGIEVRYVSYPRTGPNTESWTKAERVWCATDRKAALTQAKLGAEPAAVPECTSTPVAQEYALGHSVGLSGTPAIYSDSGVELGGYLAPTELLAQLEKKAAVQ
jgi:thiol:disulfide interchange protein DsbC